MSVGLRQADVESPIIVFQVRQAELVEHVDYCQRLDHARRSTELFREVRRTSKKIQQARDATNRYAKTHLGSYPSLQAATAPLSSLRRSQGQNVHSDEIVRRKVQSHRSLKHRPPIDSHTKAILATTIAFDQARHQIPSV